MAQRRNSDYGSQVDPSMVVSAERLSDSHAGFRIRFFLGLLTFLVGLTGFLIVLAIAITGS
ncbi:MAG: hypothetical protein M9936_30490 [Caldilinea sp.]|nr:hypothetical protein [Caldilinea sp.]